MTTAPTHSLTRSGQQGCQPKNNVADYPDHKNKSGSKCSAECSSGLIGFVSGRVNGLANLTKVRNQPNNHQNIEDDQQPFEAFSEKSSFGFSKWMPAFGAIKSFAGNAAVAARAGSQCSSHVQSLSVQSAPGFNLKVDAALLHEKIVTPLRRATCSDFASYIVG